MYFHKHQPKKENTHFAMNHLSREIQMSSADARIQVILMFIEKSGYQNRIKNI